MDEKQKVVYIEHPTGNIVLPVLPTWTSAEYIKAAMDDLGIQGNPDNYQLIEKRTGRTIYGNENLCKYPTNSLFLLGPKWHGME